jgi:hypothetical protein
MPLGSESAARKRAPGIGDVERGAELGQGPAVAGARAVEQPQSQDDAASAGTREALGLPLGVEGRAQDRRDVADQRLLRHWTFRRVDESDRGWDVDRRADRDRRVDENPRSLRAKPVVLVPLVRL